MFDRSCKSAGPGAGAGPRFVVLRGLMLLSALLLHGCAPRVLPPSLPAPDPAAATPSEGSVLAPGIVHRYEQRAEGPWAIHLVEVDPRVCGVELRTVKGREEMIGRETTSGIFARFAAETGSVAAMVNADFFRFEPDGVPEGPQVARGEVIAAAGTYGPSVSTRFGIPQPVFGVTRSGRIFVGEAGLAGQIWGSAGTLPIGRLNAAPGPDSLALFNRFGGSPLPAETGQPRALLRMLTPATAAGDVERALVVRVEISDEDLTLSANERALSGAGSAAEWVRQLSAGDTVAWHLGFAGAPGAVDELVGGFPLLILDGEPVLHRVPRIWSPFSIGRHPRTAVAVREDGIVLLVVVDGRQEGYSVGMSLAELTDLLLELGARDALNLDGGGSTTLVTERGIINRPSDPEERPVANVLLARNAGCG
jgi:hypothetical protein